MKDPSRERHRSDSNEDIAMHSNIFKKEKRSQNNFLESHVWSRISGKPCGEKNLKFFESDLEFLYFDMLKNEGRGSNRSGVKKSFVTQIVRVPKRNH